MSAIQKRHAAILRTISAAKQPVHRSVIHAQVRGISGSLLAKDLNSLIEQGVILRVGHGRYCIKRPMQGSGRDLPALSESAYQLRIESQTRQKQGIARYIVRRFCSADGTYALDAGSTLTMVFRELVERRPPSALKIVTNNLHGALLLPPSSQIELTIAGGDIRHEYAATSGELMGPRPWSIDVAVIGFSRLALNKGIWTFDRPQWLWKQFLCKARHVVFAGTVDKIGVDFVGEALCDLKANSYTVVAHADASGLQHEERERVEQVRDVLGRNLVLVNDLGDAVDELVSD